MITAYWHSRNWVSFRTLKFGTETILGLTDVLLILSVKELWSNL